MSSSGRSVDLPLLRGSEALLKFSKVAFQRGWFSAGRGSIVVKSGGEGGFITSPAFDRSTYDDSLADKLIYLSRNDTSSRLQSTAPPSVHWSDTASEHSNETGLSTPGSADISGLRERSGASMRFVFHVNESAADAEPDLEAGHGPPTAAQSRSSATGAPLRSMLQGPEGSIFEAASAMQDVPGGVQTSTEIRPVIVGGPPDSRLQVQSSSSSGSVSSQGHAVSRRASSEPALVSNAPSGKEESPAGKSQSFKIAAYPGLPRRTSSALKEYPSVLCGITRALPALANHKYKDPTVVSITARACTADSAAAEVPAYASSPRVRLHIAVDNAVGDRATVDLTCHDAGKSAACSPAAPSAIIEAPVSHRGNDAVSTSGGSACEDDAAARQPSGSRECPMAASVHMEAGSRSGRTSVSGGPASSSAPPAGGMHELLAVLLAPLRLKGDYCNVAVLNASEATLAQMEKIEAGAEEVLVDDSEVIRILNGHIGRPDDTSRLETVIPIVRAAEFDGDAAALAERVKAVMLAYPRTNAIIMPGVGMLCWGLLTNVRPMVDLYEYLLKSSTDMAREAPPQRKSRILGVSRADTAHEMEMDCPVGKLKGKGSEDGSAAAASCSEYSYDVEEGLGEDLCEAELPRPLRWNQPAVVIIACCIIIGVLGSGVGYAIRDAVEDGSWWKVGARVAFMPVISVLAMFGVIAIVCCIIVTLGPIAHVEQNSQTYSAVKPPRWRGKLPRVTVQMPVYLEGFEFVIKPSIFSLEAAIAAYRAEGGSASIFVNDDGLQLLNDEDREERIEFYRAHDIGYVARPPHGRAGFERRGRFKKASNMNYCLEVSRQVETIMAETGVDQYEALQAVRLATQAATPEHAFLAGGDVRMGEFILLVDSDTRVPQHCMLPVVTELMMSPHVAFTQHFTTPLQVAHDYFENAMAFFTNTIYNAIMVSVSGGDISPLVGHNAFLRWSAIKECAFVDPDDGKTKFWSDVHVSEDFDIAMRFQVKDFIGRYITYTGPDFKEGLSLTVHDEITRWRKYAFGCSELVFNPLKQWWCRGPLSPLFRRYLGNKCTPVTNKLTIVAYICIYIALAIAWPVACLTYFLNSKCEWYATAFEGTFEISMTCLVVFSVLTPIGNTFLLYRLGVTTIPRAAWLNIKYIVVFFFFFNGLSFHLSAAFASHLLGFRMSWGSTSKEVVDTNFFKEMRATFTNYRSMYIVFTCLALMMVVMTGVVPHTVPPAWQIRDAILMTPLAFLIGGHLLAPLVLNPSIMRVKF